MLPLVREPGATFVVRAIGDAGAPKPDISTVEAFRHMLLRAKSINALSTTGRYLTEKLLPKLGIAGEVTGKIKGGTVAAVAAGQVEIANSPRE